MVRAATFTTISTNETHKMSYFRQCGNLLAVILAT
jgi:hypothetical protein